MHAYIGEGLVFYHRNDYLGRLIVQDILPNAEVYARFSGVHKNVSLTFRPGYNFIWNPFPINIRLDEVCFHGIRRNRLSAGFRVIAPSSFRWEKKDLASLSVPTPLSSVNGHSRA